MAGKIGSNGTGRSCSIFFDFGGKRSQRASILSKGTSLECIVNIVVASPKGGLEMIGSSGIFFVRAHNV